MVGHRKWRLISTALLVAESRAVPAQANFTEPYSTTVNLNKAFIGSAANNHHLCCRKSGSCRNSDFGNGRKAVARATG
jgi:hypothetical protein